MRSISHKIKIYVEEVISRLISPIKVIDAPHTLLKIISDRKSISRFGDGEFDYIFGLDKSFQKANSEMARRLSDILTEGGTDNCLVGIPYAIYSLKPYNKKSKEFWLSYFAYNRKNLMSYLNKKAVYYDSQISRIYLNRKNRSDSVDLFNQWKQLWDNKRVLIVEGEYSRCGVENDLFTNCSVIARLICPAKNAFNYYEAIIQKTLEYACNFDIILIALGPTATILSYDLSKHGYWAIDMGNMDNEYEWMNQGVDHATVNKNRYSYEADGGETVSELDNEQYYSEIIGRVSECNEVTH